MTWRGPTYRTVDGERIDGVWCHVWLRSHWNDQYVLDDLIVYADGAVRCERQTDLRGLGKLLASGRIAVTKPGVEKLPDERSKWASRSGEPVTPEGFLLSTGDSVISYTGHSDSPFWRDARDGQGRNWVGRLLELIRSGLVARQTLLN